MPLMGGSGDDVALPGRVRRAGCRREPGLSEFTYREVGATLRRPLPPGYRHLSYRVRIGPAAAMPVAAEAIMSWAVHRRLGLRFEAEGPRAEPGCRVTTRIGVGRLAIMAPCQVVWTVTESEEVGFAYGTLAGHPARGEESFVASRSEGAVWFTVTSFSRPARWYVYAGGPVVPPLQRLYARRFAQVLKRLCR